MKTKFKFFRQQNVYSKFMQTQVTRLFASRALEIPNNLKASHFGSVSVLSLAIERSSSLVEVRQQL